MLTLDDRFVLRPDVLVQEMAGEMVVVIPGRAEFIVLNESATYLLARVQPTATLRQLADDLADHYALSSDQAQADVLSWANELINADALSVITSP